MSWRPCELGSVIDVIMGQAPPGKDCNFDGKGTPFVKAGEFGIFSPVIREWTTKPLKLGMKSDVFLCVVGATCGKINYGEDCAIGRSVAALRPKIGLIEQKFLYYFMSLLVERLREGSLGAAQTVISKEMINRIPLLLPPLATQQKIVAKLDAIFAEIDKATAAAEANAQNAEALFQSYLNKIFEENSSNTKKIKDCCLIKPPKREARTLGANDEVSFMPMDTLGINQKFAIPNQVRRLSEVVGSYTYFAEGDVLLAKITPCFENGKLGIAKNLINRVGFGSSEYFVFRPNAEVDPTWLYFYLNRTEFRNAGAKHMSGAVGHKRVTKEFIEDTFLPLPSLLEQKKLVEDIENLSAYSKSLSRSSQQKLTELEILKKSILRQAFAGELLKE